MKIPECKLKDFKDSLDKRTIHDWFELTYAQYLTIPRSILQSMPLNWQVEFVELLEELEEQFDFRPNDATYWVQLRGLDGKWLSIEKNDPYMDYERGRRVVPNKHGEIIKDFRD